MAAAPDAAAIAALHADSWRRHYRGVYSDAYLDGDAFEDRQRVWTARLHAPQADAVTIVADSAGSIVGFGHTILADDARWGSLLDNLHVSHTHGRRGIGSQLLGLAARAVHERLPGSGLYLWVNKRNKSAQAFYAAHHGRCVECAASDPPGGRPERLWGSPLKLRVAWKDLSPLLAISSSGQA